MRWRRWFLVLWLAACGGRGQETVEAEVCVETDAVSVEPLRRLSMGDYVRTLRGLFGDVPVDDLAPLLAGLPIDAAQAEGQFARQDQRLGQRHIDQTYAIAKALAERALTDGSLRQRAGEACSGNIDESCLAHFVPTFLSRALRRPAKPEELDAAIALTREFGEVQGLQAVVFTTLLKPEMLYHFETEGEVEGDVVHLTDYELAARLAYHFWGEPPDGQLREAAASGALSTTAGLRAEVNRLADDPRTQHTLDAFFEEWLHLDRGSFVPGPRLATLAPGLGTDGLAEAMRDEVETLLHHAIESPDQTWYDVLTTRDSYAIDFRLASIYGVPPWTDGAPPPQLDPDERSGLLTRAGLLATSDGSTNPFRRGAFVRRLVLCQEIPPPPADLPPDALTPPDPGPGATTREVFEAKVESPECAACHVQFSDLGYALETYDGLGRYRTEEHLVDAKGADLGTAPVDDLVTTAIGTGREAIAGAVELSDRIAESREAHECLSRQYFRYAYRRTETAADACTLDQWTQDVAQGAPLREWLRQVALDPRFRQRALED